MADDGGLFPVRAGAIIRVHPRPLAVPHFGVGGYRYEPIGTDPQTGVETLTRFATKEPWRRNRSLRSMRSLR